MLLLNPETGSEFQEVCNICFCIAGQQGKKKLFNFFNSYLISILGTD